MLRFILVRPGCTEFDLQGRIKGTLDLPLCADGARQASETAEQLASISIDAVYCAPCLSAQETAKPIADSHRLRLKVIEELHNVDHGLWHGKRVEEVRVNSPRVFRQGQEHPESICPPEGEPISDVRDRLLRTLPRLLKKHRTGVVCCVIPDPLATILASALVDADFPDLWEAECDRGGWEIFELIADPSAPLGWLGRIHQAPEPSGARLTGALERKTSA